MKISNEWLPVIVIACFALGFWLVSVLIDKLKSGFPSGAGSDQPRAREPDASGALPSGPEHPTDDRFTGPNDRGNNELGDH